MIKVKENHFSPYNLNYLKSVRYALFLMKLHIAPKEGVQEERGKKVRNILSVVFEKQ